MGIEEAHPMVRRSRLHFLPEWELDFFAFDWIAVVIVEWHLKNLGEMKKKIFLQDSGTRQSS